MMDIQIRYNEGELTHKDNLRDALLYLGGGWDKVSFSVAENERFIIYRDGTWEYRTPESLRKELIDAPTP